MSDRSTSSTHHQVYPTTPVTLSETEDPRSLLDLRPLFLPRPATRPTVYPTRTTPDTRPEPDPCRDGDTHGPRDEVRRGVRVRVDGPRETGAERRVENPRQDEDRGFPEWVSTPSPPLRGTDTDQPDEREDEGNDTQPTPPPRRRELSKIVVAWSVSVAPQPTVMYPTLVSRPRPTRLSVYSRVGGPSGTPSGVG